MAQRHLLPSGATAFEKAMSEGFDREDLIGPKIEDIRTAKIVDRPASFVPWLLIEYGLGEITRFFESGVAAIDAGIPWQRKKGTKGAIITALDWIGYDDITVHDEVVRRRAWHRVQIDMGRLPDVNRELAELLDAEYLGDISMPARSYFFRGFSGYDIRPIELSHSRLSEGLVGDSSGVRVPGGRTRWSHGRHHTVDLTISEATAAEIGIAYSNGDEIDWTLELPWDAPGIGWGGIFDEIALRNHLLQGMTIHLGFYRADGSLIGVRRAFNRATSLLGEVGFAAEVRTDFGDGQGNEVATVRCLFRRKGPEGAEARLWLAPQEVALEADAGDPVLLQSSAGVLQFKFARTIREMVRFSVRLA